MIPPCRIRRHDRHLLHSATRRANRDAKLRVVEIPAEKRGGWRVEAEFISAVHGLERVTRKQREAADKIRSDTLALQALQGASPPDQPKIDELGNQLVWETRIFEDRSRVIKFVCEVPTAIDQRLFALGRVIQQEME